MANYTKLTQEELLKRVHSILSDILKSTPQREKAYYKGFNDALYESFFQSALEHGGFIQGQYSTTSKGNNYYEKRGITSRQFYDGAESIGLYYKNTEGLKPYFIVERDKG